MKTFLCKLLIAFLPPLCLLQALNLLLVALECNMEVGWRVTRFKRCKYMQQVEHLRWQVGDVCQCCRSDLFTPWFQGKGEWHSLCLQVISNDLSASARCCLLLASAISHSFSHLRFVNIC